MAKTAIKAKPPVTQDAIDACLAKAVSDGDIVNFRFLFISYSPLRDGTSEDIAVEKYNYLRPGKTDSAAYRAALGLVQRADIRQHVRAQLAKSGPAQFHSELVLALADNAVRLGKYRSAAQAYELIRIRRRMKDLFLDRADAALDRGDIKEAVQGYRIGAGLDYDYAAFPEPLPASPNYQARALILHARYPQKPEESLALLPPESHVREALNYLVLDTEAAARLAARPLGVQVDFVCEWVRRQDPRWGEFVARYLDACELVRVLGERMQQAASQKESARQLAQEVMQQEGKYNPHDIEAKLLGRAIEGGEWWQYLKDLAYAHPAAALFVGRQLVSPSVEIIMPRLRDDSPLAAKLGLTPA